MVTITLNNKHNTFISHKKSMHKHIKTCKSIIKSFLLKFHMQIAFVMNIVTVDSAICIHISIVLFLNKWHVDA
jgi:hypothetical protein